MQENRPTRKDNQRGFSSVERVPGKRLPVNLEAEKSVLASVLLNDDNFSLVADLLFPTDFYLRSHQNIYSSSIKDHGRCRTPHPG